VTSRTGWECQNGERIVGYTLARGITLSWVYFSKRDNSKWAAEEESSGESPGNYFWSSHLCGSGDQMLCWWQPLFSGAFKHILFCKTAGVDLALWSLVCCRLLILLLKFQDSVLQFTCQTGMHSKFLISWISHRPETVIFCVAIDTLKLLTRHSARDMLQLIFEAEIKLSRFSWRTRSGTRYYTSGQTVKPFMEAGRSLPSTMTFAWDIFASLQRGASEFLWWGSI
jgi:hypothetical protein